MPQAAEIETDTQGKILSTATRLFSEQGYENTSLSQVAREAHVSKALIFWHFDNKEKLFQAALQRATEPYFIDVDDIGSLEAAAQIERLIDLFFEFVSENVYSVRFLFTLILRQKGRTDEAMSRVSELYGVFRHLLADVIRGGRDAGTFRPDVEPSLDASLILAALGGVLIENFMGGEPAGHTRELLVHLKRTTLARLNK